MYDMQVGASTRSPAYPSWPSVPARVLIWLVLGEYMRTVLDTNSVHTTSPLGLTTQLWGCFSCSVPLAPSWKP
jgi:hypothetical protein